MEENKELKPMGILSPSAINLYYKCPREYYNTYILKLPKGENIHLIKGIITHTILEGLFNYYKNFNKQYIINSLNSQWKKYKDRLEKLNLSERQILLHKQDCYRILIKTFNKYLDDIKLLVFSLKVKDEEHGFNLIKPHTRELHLKSETLKCQGYVDRVDKDYDGLITIGDYKTSGKYGLKLSQDYKRQLAIYAVLYAEEEGVYPDYASIMFLRYGENYIFEVTPSFIKHGQDAINYVWENTRSIDIKDYPLNETNLCKYCQFFKDCVGKKQEELTDRLDNLKKILKK